MKILLMNIPDTFNYGSMMLGENTIEYLNKRFKGISYYIDTPSESHIKRLKIATEYDKIYFDELMSPKLIFKKIRGLRKIERFLRSKNNFSKIGEFYDAIILLGGDDYSEVYWDPNTKKGNNILKGRLKRLYELTEVTKVFMLGQTIGPYTGERIPYAHKAFNNAILYSRDEESINFLNSIGVKSKITRDMAFLPLHLQNEYTRNDDYITKYGLERDKYITLIGTGLFKQYDVTKEVLQDVFKKTVKYLKKKYPEKKIIYLAHVINNHSGDNFLFNEKELEEIFDFSISKSLLPVEARTIIGNSYFTLTCRMHPSVSSFQMRKPAICISYSMKYEGVISKGLNLPEIVINGKGEDKWEKEVYNEIVKKVEYVEKNYNKLVSKIDKNVSKCEKEIMKMFNEIGDILQEK